jgi:hypothetical protein
MSIIPASRCPFLVRPGRLHHREPPQDLARPCHAHRLPSPPRSHRRLSSRPAPGRSPQHTLSRPRRSRTPCGLAGCAKLRAAGARGLGSAAVGAPGQAKPGWERRTIDRNFCSCPVARPKAGPNSFPSRRITPRWQARDRPILWAIPRWRAGRPALRSGSRRPSPLGWQSGRHAVAHLSVRTSSEWAQSSLSHVSSSTPSTAPMSAIAFS